MPKPRIRHQHIASAIHGDLRNPFGNGRAAGGS